MRKILCAIIGLFAITAHAATTDVCDFDIANIYKVGTPTITNAGIYTTNSSESYIRTQNDVAFATANTWSFKWRFTYHPANSDQGIMSGNGDTNVQAIINSAGRPRFSFGNDTSWNAGVWNDTALTFAYQDGVTYDNEIYFDGTRYGFKVNGTEIGGVDNTTKAANTYFAIGVERGRVSTQYSRAEWDLTHTSLTLDGVEQLPWCGKQIKIATTKYVESEFAPMVSALQSAISVVDSVVSRTISQAASIATLQSGKQTRPADDTCPAYKQCLLVEDEQGVPHWYQITDPFRDFVAPIIANNVAPSNVNSAKNYTQLEYIESTGTQWIDTGVSVNNRNSFEIQYKGLSGGYLVSQGTNSLRITTSQVSWFSDHYHFVANPSADDFHIIDFGYDYMKVDGVNITGSTDHDNTSGTSVFLFAKNSSDNNSSAQVKYFKIYDASGTLVRNFVPVIDNATVKVGMYDTVGGQFYGNAATSGDDFTPGPIVENDADVPGATWTATWAADATTSVSAGAVSGITWCNTGSNNQPAAGDEVGGYCWCKATQLQIDGKTTSAPDSMKWVGYQDVTLENCTKYCGYYCSQTMRNSNNNRNQILRN